MTGQGELKLRAQVLKLAAGGCTADEAAVAAQYDAARQAADEAIKAEAELSPDVVDANAALQAAQSVLNLLGSSGSIADHAIASSRVTAARTALDQARDAARKRITEREFPGGRPVLAPGCPPGTTAPPPATPPQPVAPDPNSHSSTLGVRLPPKPQPNTKAGD